LVYLYFYAMIKRLITERVLESLSFFPVVGILGPRQVGKTTLARVLEHFLEKPTIYLDLELPGDFQKLADAESYLSQHVEKCVIIDEIQLRPELFSLLRALVDQKRVPARFILLGSASPYIVKNVSETLAGRIAYHELAPFSWSEIEENIDFRTHWFRGGFPNALLAPTDNLSLRWLNDFTQTFIERDLQRLRFEVPASTLQRLLSMIGYLHGGMLNQTQLGQSLGVSQPTINRYLELLEGSFLIRRLTPWFSNAGKRIVKTPKIYFRDTGLLHRLWGLPNMEALYGHPNFGASWESYVIEQIMTEAGEFSEFFFYRTQNGAECDLIWKTPRNKTVCIEIKHTSAPIISRGFYESAEDVKADFRYVLVAESEPFLKPKDVKVCSLRHFLKNELPNL
jgi:uncharacterized protein